MESANTNRSLNRTVLKVRAHRIAQRACPIDPILHPWISCLRVVTGRDIELFCIIALFDCTVQVCRVQIHRVHGIIVLQIR